MTSLHAQDDSLRCFTIEESKTLLKFAERGLICDSLTQAYEGKVHTLEEIIQNKDGQILLADEVIKSQRDEIIGLNRKIKWFRYGLATTGALCLVETIIILLP